MGPKAGQKFLLNKRLWTIKRQYSLGGRNLAFEVVGASPASLGMTRHLKAVRYGDDLFIEQRQQGYWHGHLQHDWVDHEFGPTLACQPATWLEVLNIHTQHPADGNLKNEFSWSFSRAAKYKVCARAYYYHYYAAWEGWQSQAPAPVKRAYLLKNLTGLSRWVGNLAHDAIKFALAQLKAGRPTHETDLIERMYSRAQTDFADSQSGRYQQKPNRLTGFQEHYYQIDPAATDWQTAWARAQDFVRTFVNSDLYTHLRRQAPDTFLDIEKLQSFPVAGVKVWVQMDLARQEGDTLYIYDWKTGSTAEENLRTQLGIYGLYARQAWPEIASRNLRGLVYALAEDKVLEFDLNDTALQETQAMIAESIQQLRGLLTDPQENLAELQRFPMIDDLQVCQQCQFRELCGRDTA